MHRAFRGGDECRIHTFRCSPRSDPFKRGANRIDAYEIGVRELADIGTPEGFRDDEPEEFEIAQCLAHWPLADTKLLCKACLDDPLVGL